MNNAIPFPQENRLPDPEPQKQPEQKQKIILDERGMVDLPFLLITVLLVTIGVIMMFSASYASAYASEDSSTFYFARQGLFALAGICVAVSALWISVYARTAAPVIVQTPEAALVQVETMMDAFCEGDYAAASGCLYGTPNLGMDRDAADSVGVQIWEAFETSMHYELVGECYATDAGLTQKILVTTLDIKAVTDYVVAHARENIETKAQAAKDYDEVFDENDEYREEFIRQVLEETTAAALAQTNASVTTEVTLNLVWSEGRWWIVSSEELLRAISGGIVK